MLRAAVLALIGTASFIAVYVAMNPSAYDIRETPRETASIPPATATRSERVDFSLRAIEPIAALPSRESVAPPVRDVTPANMTAGPAVTGPLARIEPPAPAEPIEPAPPELERLFNPVVESAGMIKAGHRDIRLAGISAPELEAMCGKGEEAWPCGRMARAALRRFVRGRAIECEIDEDGALRDPARCSVAGEDMSAWLVAQGWAEAEMAALDRIETKARESKLGIWNDARPDDQPDAVAAAR